MCPIEAPICTVGPSRPSAIPEPSDSRPPKNFTGKTRSFAGSISPAMIASTRCMPLPEAPGRQFQYEEARDCNRDQREKDRYDPTDIGMTVR